MDLKRIVEKTDTTAGRIFAWSIQVLIILSLITFAIETLPNLSPAIRRWLYIAETTTVAIFTVEYLLRLYLAGNKIRYIFSFYAIIDLLAILPFYLRLGIDLRSVRIFRLFRLFRILKLARYNSAIDRFKKAFLQIREELMLTFVATMFVLFLSSVGIYYFEGEKQPEQFGSVFHCMWWSIVTLTTVGFGDCYPMTLGGKIFTGVLLLLGLGLVAVPTALIASALTLVGDDPLPDDDSPRPIKK